MSTDAKNAIIETVNMIWKIKDNVWFVIAKDYVKMKKTSLLSPDDLIIKERIAARPQRKKKKVIVKCVHCGTLSINNSHTCYSKWS